jgi:hypothetical protein
LELRLTTVNQEVKLRSIHKKPPNGVDFGLQKGRGSNDGAVDRERSASDLHFACTVTASLRGEDQHRNELDEGNRGFYCSKHPRNRRGTRDTSPEQATPGTSENSSYSLVAASETDPLDGLCLDVLYIPAGDEADDRVGTLVPQLLERHIRRRVFRLAQHQKCCLEVEHANPRVARISAFRRLL